MKSIFFFNFDFVKFQNKKKILKQFIFFCLIGNKISIHKLLL